MTCLSNERPAKRYKFACAPIKNLDQPVYPCGLIRVLDGHSVSSQGSSVSSA